MNENNLTQTTNEHDTLQSIVISEVRQKISNTANDAENTAKEKYIAKQKLIESADDMTTHEKLNAMDKNYDRRNQERWQNVFYFAVISFSVVGLAIGSPVAVKNVRCISQTENSPTTGFYSGSEAILLLKGNTVFDHLSLAFCQNRMFYISIIIMQPLYSLLAE